MLGSRRTLGFIAVLIAASLALPADVVLADESVKFGKRRGTKRHLVGEGDTPRGQRAFFCKADIRSSSDECKVIERAGDSGALTGVANGERSRVFIQSFPGGMTYFPSLASVNLDTLTLTRDCGPTGQMDFMNPPGGLFLPTHAALTEGGTKILTLGQSPSGAAWVGEFNFQTCELIRSKTFELGNMSAPDMLKGLIGDGGGGFFLFGQEGNVGNVNSALVHINSALDVVGTPLVMDFGGGASDSLVGANLNGSEVDVVGNAGPIFHRCFNQSNLSPGSCVPNANVEFGAMATDCDFNTAGVGSPFSGPPALLSLSSGSLLVAGVCRKTADPDIALMSLQPGGAFDNGFSGDGRAIYHDNTNGTTDVFPFAVDYSPTDILVFGDQGFFGSRKPFVFTADYDGGNPHYAVVNVPDDPPVMGLEDGPGGTPPPGAGPPPPPPPPPPVQPCKCKALKAKVLRPVRTLLIENKIDFEFTLEWELECTAGSGTGCSGTVQPLPPKGLKFKKVKPKTLPIVCKGPCAGKKTGKTKVAYRTDFKRFSPSKRRNKTFIVRISRKCDSRELVSTYRIRFNRNSVLDRDRSDLDGDGREDKSKKKIG